MATPNAIETPIYHESDATLEPLDRKTVAVIGYGNQGRAQARNMHDSGVSVIVGSREDSSHEQAVADGFEVYSIPDATARADVVLLLIPDEVQPEIYEHDIAPNTEAGDTLVFASGHSPVRSRLHTPSEPLGPASSRPNSRPKLVPI